MTIRRELYRRELCPGCGREKPVKRDERGHIPGSIRSRLFTLMLALRSTERWLTVAQLVDELVAQDGRRGSHGAVAGALGTMFAAHEVEARWYHPGVYRLRASNRKVG